MATLTINFPNGLTSAGKLVEYTYDYYSEESASEEYLVQQSLSFDSGATVLTLDNYSPSNCFVISFSSTASGSTGTLIPHPITNDYIDTLTTDTTTYKGSVNITEYSPTVIPNNITVTSYSTVDTKVFSVGPADNTSTIFFTIADNSLDFLGRVEIN